MILVCGATGELGSRTVRGLRAAGADVRALVRPASDASAIADTGAELAEGDFRDVASLRQAVEGVDTVVSTVTAIGRLLAGEKGSSIGRVDVGGHQTLIAAAEATGVQRFVFVSATRMRDEPGSPLADGKVAIEDRLSASPLREVVVRPDMFQELWLAPITQFDWPKRRVLIQGKGETPARYVAIDDVAAALTALTLAGDPPRLVEFGGPDALTRKQAVAVFEQALGEPIRRRHLPRPVVRAAASVLRRPQPALASVMALGLVADLVPATWDDRPLRELGITPRGVRAFAAAEVSRGRV